MYTRLCYQSNITCASGMFHNLLSNNDKTFQMSVVSRHQLWHHLVLKNNGTTVAVFCQQVTGAQRLGGLHRKVRYTHTAKV